MTPDVQDTHPAANFRACMVALTERFEGVATLNATQLREWEQFFAERPKDLCVEAISRYYREAVDPFPKLGVLRQHLDAVLRERAPAGATAAERTAQYLEEQKRLGREARASWGALFDWVRALGEEERRELKARAVERFGGADPERRARYEQRDPFESPGLAAAMRHLKREQDRNRPAEAR
jgi:hypothetical protein